MALTIQSVADDAAYEIRLLLDGTSGSGDAYNLLVRWIDQTQKDLLHSSAFEHMLRSTTTITSVTGTYNYNLTPTDVRKVVAVYDRQGARFLLPIDTLFAPTQLTDDKQGSTSSPAPDKHVSQFRMSTPYPQFWWVRTVVTTGTNAHTLYLYPTPKAAENAGTVDVHYIKQIASVTGASTALTVGEDGRDAMVAGVVARAYDYLRMGTKAAVWRAEYERIKAAL